MFRIFGTSPLFENLAVYNLKKPLISHWESLQKRFKEAQILQLKETLHLSAHKFSPKNLDNIARVLAKKFHETFPTWNKRQIVTCLGLGALSGIAIWNLTSDALPSFDMPSPSSSSSGAGQNIDSSILSSVDKRELKILNLTTQEEFNFFSLSLFATSSIVAAFALYYFLSKRHKDPFIPEKQPEELPPNRTTGSLLPPPRLPPMNSPDQPQKKEKVEQPPPTPLITSVTPEKQSEEPNVALRNPSEKPSFRELAERRIEQRKKLDINKLSDEFNQLVAKAKGNPTEKIELQIASLELLPKFYENIYQPKLTNVILAAGLSPLQAMKSFLKTAPITHEMNAESLKKIIIEDTKEKLKQMKNLLDETLFLISFALENDLENQDYGTKSLMKKEEFCELIDKIKNLNEMESSYSKSYQSRICFEKTLSRIKDIYLFYIENKKDENILSQFIEIKNFIKNMLGSSLNGMIHSAYQLNEESEMKEESEVSSDLSLVD